MVKDNELFVIFNLSLTMLKICKIGQKNLHLENRGVKVQTIKFVMHVKLPQCYKCKVVS